MATITKHYTPIHFPDFGLRRRYKHLMDELDFSYFAVISFTIAVGSIFGGAGLMFTFGNHAPLWQPITGMTLALANNVAAIGQAPIRWVVALFILTVLVNSVFILINVF
jgi:hypothetical protein